MGKQIIWLTPVWMLAAGLALGLIILGASYLLLLAFAPGRARLVGDTVREGILQPILIVAAVLSIFALAASAQMPIGRFYESLTRVGAVGTETLRLEVPPLTEDKPIDVAFRAAELRSYQITSDEDLLLTTGQQGNQQTELEVDGGQTTDWKKGDELSNPFSGYVSSLYATNVGEDPAELVLTFTTGIEYPQVFFILWTAVALIALVGLYFLVRMTMPKLAAIAATTAKHGYSQPVFLVSMILGLFLLLLFVYVPYNTLGEDIKMLKVTGLTLIMVLAILVALWTASVSVAEEIEGKTALTLLSKPIGRRQFVLGKFLGVVWPIVLMFVLLGLWFLGTVSYKVIYDARETVSGTPTWQQCYTEMVSVLPGLALALMETIILAAISVAISTRLPMLPNLIICFSIYVVGNLVQPIVESSAGEFPIVRFVGMFLATILPVLDHFNLDAGFASGSAVPPHYLAWSLLYSVVYCTVAMLLALILFEDRDLA